MKYLTKWLSKFAKGFWSLPKYLTMRGPITGIRRITWLTLAHGIHGLRQDFWFTLTRESSSADPSLPLDYILIAPNWISSSAGIGCLYKLGYDLKLRGYSVAITGSFAGDPNRPLPLINKRMAVSEAKRGAWVVYPETITGNPLKGKNVIRWVLNSPGLLGGDKVYADNEQVFIYSDVYRPYVANHIVGKLYLPTLDPKLFHLPMQETERALTCFYVGKSTFKDGYFDQANAFEINRHSPNRKDLALLLRHARTLYCFDNSTILAYEAILSGCPVVIIPDGTHQWSDYEKLELGTEGFHWNKKYFVPPLPNTATLEKTLKDAQKEYQESVDFLIAHTQAIYRTKAFAETPKKPNLPTSSLQANDSPISY